MQGLVGAEPHPESIRTVSFKIPRAAGHPAGDVRPSSEEGSEFTRYNIFRAGQQHVPVLRQDLRAQRLEPGPRHPRDRGGPTTWENIVCSCIPCNTRKANHSPQEVGMHLIRKPKRPKWRPFIQINLGLHQHEKLEALHRSRVLERGTRRERQQWLRPVGGLMVRRHECRVPGARIYSASTLIEI